MKQSNLCNVHLRCTQCKIELLKISLKNIQVINIHWVPVFGFAYKLNEYLKLKLELLKN